MELRNKYSKRLTDTKKISKKFNYDKFRFKESSKDFLDLTTKVIANYTKALISLKEFSSSMLLKVPVSAMNSFDDFMLMFPGLVNSNLNKIFKTFVDFKSFCIQDLFGKKCLIEKNLTEINANFEDKLESLKGYDLSNATKIYPEDLIAHVKNVLTIIISAKDMIANVDLNSNFDGFSEEYIFELEKLNEYLNKKKIIKVSKYTPKEDNNNIDIGHFERDFTNLIKSTQFICYNIKKPFFLDL